ncbi:MAG: hypothetical protein Fues2KO_18370 [Fuerstiella sp.]
MIGQTIPGLCGVFPHVPDAVMDDAACRITFALPLTFNNRNCDDSLPTDTAIADGDGLSVEHRSEDDGGR